MVEEKPPIQARAGKQDRPIRYDSNLLPTLRQWVQGVIMFGDLNSGQVAPEWYSDLAALRLQVIVEKDYYTEAMDTMDGQDLAEDGNAMFAISSLTIPFVEE